MGLNYLLNDQQDRAIETFIAALEANSETVDMHIALAHLFRSRGEADRAARICQQLLVRPALAADQQERLQLELAQDFLALGLLDRAEQLLTKLVRDTQQDERQLDAQRLLIDLLEREGEWQRALEVARPRLLRESHEIRCAAAHWLCELGEQARLDDHIGSARRLLRQALDIDPRCVRASLALADAEHSAGRYRAAIHRLRQVPEQDADFTPIMLPALTAAYRRLGDEEGLIRHLEQLVAHTPYTSAIIALAEALHDRDGIQAAIHLVSEQLNREPSLRALDYLIHLYLRRSADGPQQQLQLLQRHTTTLLTAFPRYLCGHCGFTGEALHWRCPRCRGWGSVKPIIGIKGE